MTISTPHASCRVLIKTTMQPFSSTITFIEHVVGFRYRLPSHNPQLSSDVIASCPVGGALVVRRPRDVIVFCVDVTICCDDLWKVHRRLIAVRSPSGEQYNHQVDWARANKSTKQ